MGRKHASQIAAVEKNRLSDVAARTAMAGEEVWQLRKYGRVLTCALRNDDRVEVDVQLLEGGELLVSRRCPRDDVARFLAENLRQDHVRTGWTK